MESVDVYKTKSGAVYVSLKGKLFKNGSQITRPIQGSAFWSDREKIINLEEGCEQLIDRKVLEGKSLVRYVPGIPSISVSTPVDKKISFPLEKESASAEIKELKLYLTKSPEELVRKLTNILYTNGFFKHVKNQTLYEFGETKLMEFSDAFPFVVVDGIDSIVMRSGPFFFYGYDFCFGKGTIEKVIRDELALRKYEETLQAGTEGIPYDWGFNNICWRVAQLRDLPESICS